MTEDQAWTGGNLQALSQLTKIMKDVSQLSGEALKKDGRTGSGYLSGIVRLSESLWMTCIKREVKTSFFYKFSVRPGPCDKLKDRSQSEF